MPRMLRRVPGLVRLCALLCACSLPGVAMADAPHDIPGNMRLWLDGLDVYATDTGNGGGTNPAGGAQVTGWVDKSSNGFTAGDAVDYGGSAHSYPTYTAGSGVSFDGVSNVLEIPSGLYSGLGAITKNEIYAVASARQVKSQYLLRNGPGLGTPYIGIAVPTTGDSIWWDHGGAPSVKRTSTSWTGTLGNSYLYNFIANPNNSSQSIYQDGTLLTAGSAPQSYTQGAADKFFLGSGVPGQQHDGVISELIVYSRLLLTAERNILQSYLAAKHGNPGGAGTAGKYSNSSGWRYHVGGIGQEAGSALSTGTSAGLTIANSTFLANTCYLLAGLDALNPATGSTAADVNHATFVARSSRVWYMQRSGTCNTGNVTVTFNLAQMGVSAQTGTTVSLFYRSGTSGAFSSFATTTYNGSGSVSLTVANLQSGYYALGLPGTPQIAATMSNAMISDGVNTSNFKAIPGALVKETVTVTNSGTGSPDANSTVLSFPVPANVKLYVGDLGAVGSGPVLFAQGTTGSGLSYAYTSLSSMTDGLDFSKDSGATWAYVPTPDAQQADSAITNVRVKTTGTFASGTSPNFPSFALSYGLVVN